MAAVRDALGARLGLAPGLAASDPALLGRFLAAHHLAVKALARDDDELLRTLLPWLPFETTDGAVTLDEFSRGHQTILVTRTVEEFRQVSSIAAAAGLGIVNGGYTYDRDLVRRLPELRPGVTGPRSRPGHGRRASGHRAEPAVELAAARFLKAGAQGDLDGYGCDVALRSFHPVTVPALLLDDREARHERARAGARRPRDGLWADILGALRAEAPRAQLVLNHANR